MIDVFERLAPAYGRIVRKLALDVWYDRANVGEFLHKADFFRRRYENQLTEFFKDRGYLYRPRRIRDLSRRWLSDQLLIPRKLETISALKKGKIIEDLSELSAEAKKEAIKLYQGARLPPEGRVSPVLSFSENLMARAVQLGEESAFALGRDINSDTVRLNSDVYRWCTQEDKAVRPTHRKLARKLFSVDDPPTTVDRYGHTHTGNPGTDWGCRCWEEPAQGKPLSRFVAHE